MTLEGERVMVRNAQVILKNVSVKPSKKGLRRTKNELILLLKILLRTTLGVVTACFL